LAVGRAILRLLARLSRKDAESFSSLGLNNLFLCVAFLVSSSTNPRTAFWSAFPFLVILIVPLLCALSADALKRIPDERWKLWPLSPPMGALLRVLSVALNPAFWLGGVILLAWAGLAPSVAFILLAVLVQAVVGLGSWGRRRFGGTSLLQLMPQPPGRLGGILQVGIRQLSSTLDFYTALMLCMGGALYRCLSTSPNPEAYPVVALLVALSLSTYAQRSFGLDAKGGMTRLRLLPLEGWQILVAKDAVFLGVTALLVLPLNLRVGVTCSLVTLAIGRWPSLRQSAPQRRWRFTGGDIRFGVLQVVAGSSIGISAYRISPWFLAGALCLYAVSLVLGDRWWRSSG
jgi:hypothetical protein